jgi:hypothetical protein
MKILTAVTEQGLSVSINCDSIVYVSQRASTSGCVIYMIEKPNGLILKDDYLEVVGFLKAE